MPPWPPPLPVALEVVARAVPASGPIPLGYPSPLRKISGKNRRRGRSTPRRNFTQGTNEYAPGNDGDGGEANGAVDGETLEKGGGDWWRESEEINCGWERERVRATLTW
jgi:hypothetical protein